MFVFDLFEKKKQDPAAGRFVGGTSQDARVKNALDNAYRAVPAAKSPEEAALGYIDIQNSLNQKQDQVLSQQNKTNQQQTQQINALVADMRRKEKDFRDLNAQIANMPNVTPQQVARMAQDIEASHDAGKDQPVDVPNVVAKQTAAQPAKTVAAPGPGASVSQLANYQQAKDQGAATAKTTAKAPVATPQATPAPATSKALGQMASQLATPGRVIKGKNQQAQQTAQPTQTTTTDEPPVAANDAGNVRNLLRAAESITEQQPGQILSVPKNNTPEEIAQANLDNISLMAVAGKPVKLYFSDGQGPTLPYPQLKALFDYLRVLNPNDADTKSRVTNLLSNSRFFYEYMLNNIVGQTHVNPVPQGQDIPDEQDPQAKLLEGDVVPMTDDETTNQAYADALIFLKRVYANPDDPMITTMRQDFAHKYQQRFQISQAPAPDRSYYLLDKQLSKKYKLPTPDFKGLEEDSWHNGQNSWSSEHDQWAKESTSPASPKDSIQRYLAIDAEDDVEAVKAAIHAISKDPELKPTAKARLLGQVGMIIKTHRLPIGRAYYQFMQQFMESQGKEPLSVGDPVIVTAPNEYEGKTGEIAEFSPSGNFVIVDLYNYGEHSMHLSDVEYNKYADEEDEVDEVDEGWSDAMVAKRTGQPRTPYSVYIKGKKWKDFSNDDHAEAVANKLRAKFKADGRDPSVITIAPTDITEGVTEEKNIYTVVFVDPSVGPKVVGKFKNVVEAKKLIRDSFNDMYDTGDHLRNVAPGIYVLEEDYRNTGERATAKNYKHFYHWIIQTSQGVAEAGDRVDPILIRALERMPDGLATHDQVLNAAYDAYAMELGKMKMKSDYGVTRAYIPQLMDLYKNKYGLDIKEAQTDYEKRRQRERDVDAGKPVKPLPRNPQTDYAKKRAKEKRDLEQFGETTNYWTRLQNERNTKIASLVNELKESIEKK